MSARGESSGSSAAVRLADLPRPTDAWFRSVVEAANEGIWIIDRAARTIFANERMAAMLGTTPDRMSGLTPFDFLFPEDLEAARAVMASNFEGTPVEFEIRFRRADGGEIPVLAGSAPLRDDDGRITGSVATFSDLSARKAAESQLAAREREAQESASLLGLLMESAIDAIWMRDIEGRFQVANPAACAIMGKAPEAIIGASIEEIWGEEMAAHLRDEAQRLFERRRGITVEEQMFHAGKQRMTTFVSNKVPLFAADGSPLGILGVSRDISDRKRAEDELRASEERLAQQVSELNALYGSAPLGLAFFDRDYRYLRVNEELAAINGVPADEHIGKTVREVLGDHAGDIEPVISQVFETGEAVGGVEASGHKPRESGVMRHWLAGFYPVRAKEGPVDAVGAWVIEISERKAAEQRELLLAREVDHRAKNLLAVVQSIVQLTPAVDGAALKSSIVGRIQALARAHSLLSDSRWDGVSLGDLVREELEPFAGPGDGRISVNGSGLLLRPAAAQSLALVLHELATNAAKYGALSNESGKVSVEWRRDSGPAGGSLEMLWVESGGPAPGNPELTGFGSKIIHASVNRQLRGKVVKEWLDDGLRCTIRIPAAEVVPGSDAAPE